MRKIRPVDCFKKLVRLWMRKITTVDHELQQQGYNFYATTSNVHLVA